MILTHHGIDSLRRTEYVNIGGYDYKVIRIGNKKWINENLKLAIGSGYWYNNNRSTYEPLRCGILYSYDTIAVINNYLTLNNTGWRVATHADFVDVFIEVTHAYELKAVDVDYWTGSLPGTDVLGFSAVPAGSYNSGVGFQNFGIFCGWFTEDLYSSARAFTPALNQTDNMYPDLNSDRYNNYLPVRLVKDVV
jgi:uncharacterized protein (TIGR02145 family)